MEAVTLGLRQGLDSETRDLFSRSGVYHILAVSGLHVGIIAFILYTVLGALRVPRRGIPIIIVAVLFIYSFVADLKPSVIRASIMASIFLIGLVLERKTHPLNLLGIALLVVLIADPHAPQDLSFQLSFAATASILLILCRYPMTSKNALRRWLLKPLLISLSAQAGTAPIVAYHFFRLPLLSALVNLYVVPAVTVSIALAFASQASTLISLSVARILAAANWLVINSIFLVVRTLGSLEYAEIVTGRPSLPHLLVYFFLFVLLLNMRERWARRVFVFTLLFAGNIFVWREVAASPPFRSTFLSIERSSSIVETPSGRVILIDCGSEDDFSWVVAPALQEKGIGRIDLVLLTQCTDLTGAISLLSQFDVSLVVTPHCPCRSRKYIQILRECLEGSSRHLGVQAGDRLVIDEVEIEFLFPDEVVTEFASAFQVRYRDTDFLWLAEEGHLLSRLPLEPEHEVVHSESHLPAIPAVLSVFRRPPRAASPSADSVQRETEHQIFTTRGAVVVVTDGSRISVVQWPHRRDRAIR
jgi:competence protein ComEC